MTISDNERIEIPPGTEDAVLFRKVGNRIKVAREERGLTGEALGAAIGVSQSLISQVENGSRLMSLPNYMKLSRYFKVPLYILFSDRDWSEENFKAIYNACQIIENPDDPKDRESLMHQIEKMKPARKDLPQGKSDKPEE